MNNSQLIQLTNLTDIRRRIGIVKDVFPNAKESIKKKEDFVRKHENKRIWKCYVVLLQCHMKRGLEAIKCHSREECCEYNRRGM